MKYENLLFDLDGTIIDPRIGITTSYIDLLKELGREVPSPAVLLSSIGPPLRECLGKFLNTTSKEEIDRAVVRYRHYYVEKQYMFKDRPYDGIDHVLESLTKKKYRLFIATSKAHTYAGDILRHFKLSHYFLKVYGSELDGTRGKKADLLDHLLETEGLDPAKTLMIGDRHHDVDAALANKMPCLGVSYGYGSITELTEAGAYKICATPLDILKEL
jgi:phosphoglycolate phosphatase